MMGLGIKDGEARAQSKSKYIRIWIRVAIAMGAHTFVRATCEKRIKRKIKKEQTRIESSQLRALHTVCDVIWKPTFWWFRYIYGTINLEPNNSSGSNSCTATKT